jgi:hypothetical protein
MERRVGAVAVAVAVADADAAGSFTCNSAPKNLSRAAGEGLPIVAWVLAPIPFNSD